MRCATSPEEASKARATAARASRWVKVEANRVSGVTRGDVGSARVVVGQGHGPLAGEDGQDLLALDLGHRHRPGGPRARVTSAIVAGLGVPASSSG